MPDDEIGLNCPLGSGNCWLETGAVPFPGTWPKVLGSCGNAWLLLTPGIFCGTNIAAEGLRLEFKLFVKVVVKLLVELIVEF